MSKEESFFINRKEVKTVGDYDFKLSKDKQSCGFDEDKFNQKVSEFSGELRQGFDEFFNDDEKVSVTAVICKKHEDYFTKRELAYLLTAKFLGEIQEDIQKIEKEKDGE